MARAASRASARRDEERTPRPLSCADSPQQAALGAWLRHTTYQAESGPPHRGRASSKKQRHGCVGDRLRQAAAKLSISYTSSTTPAGRPVQSCRLRPESCSATRAVPLLRHQLGSLGSCPETRRSAGPATNPGCCAATRGRLRPRPAESARDRPPCGSAPDHALQLLRLRERRGRADEHRQLVAVAGHAGKPARIGHDDLDPAMIGRRPGSGIRRAHDVQQGVGGGAVLTGGEVHQRVAALDQDALSARSARRAG